MSIIYRYLRVLQHISLYVSTFIHLHVCVPDSKIGYENSSEDTCTRARASVCACKCARFEKGHQLYIYRTYAHTVRAGEDWSLRRMKVCQNYTAAAPGPEKQNLRSALYFIIRTTCSAVVLSRRVHVCVRVKKNKSMEKKNVRVSSRRSS